MFDSAQKKNHYLKTILVRLVLAFYVRIKVSWGWYAKKILFVYKFCIKNIKILRYYTERQEGNIRGYAEITPASCCTVNVVFSIKSDKKHLFAMHWNRKRKRAPRDSRTTGTAPAPWQLWASSCCCSPWAEWSPSLSGFSSGDECESYNKDADESRLWWQIMMWMNVSFVHRRWLNLKTSFSRKYIFLGKSSIGMYFSSQEILHFEAVIFCK